jgi:hypothetical protein
VGSKGRNISFSIPYGILGMDLLKEFEITFLKPYTKIAREKGPKSKNKPVWCKKILFRRKL